MNKPLIINIGMFFFFHRYSACVKASVPPPQDTEPKTVRPRANNLQLRRHATMCLK